MLMPRVLSAVVLCSAIAAPVVRADAPPDAAAPKPAPTTPAPKPTDAAAPKPADATAPKPADAAAPKPAAAPAPNTAAPTPNPDAPPPLTPAAPVVSPLQIAVENFWHFSKIAKYDLAAAEAQKIVDPATSPAEVLSAFQSVAAERNDDLFETLYRWMNVDPMKDPVQKIVAKLKEGQLTHITDPAIIKKAIARLSVNERAFEMALAELRDSGEFAVPIMVDTLRDPAQKNLRSQTRRALVRLGRGVLNPLVAVLESKDHDTLITVMGIVSEIGYPAAAPYIARVYASKDAGMDEVKAAAARALTVLGVDAQSQKPADLFYDLGEKFYYNNASIVPDNRFPDAHIWSWDDAKGLTYKDVPSPIFNEIMSKRCAEYALKLDPSRADVVALWLAAENKREAEIPEGKTDPTHEGPDAHFYNVALGTQYCNAVLSRSLKDRTAPVALKVVKSLQEIIGQSNMFQGGNADGKEPIVAALQFPDRLVRFEAAITLGSALPQQPFAGQEWVVPTLAEAVNNSSKANIVIVAPDLNAANAMKESLKDAVRADTASDASGAMSAEGRLPSVDVLVLDSRGNKDNDAILAGPRVQGVAKLIIVESKASPFAAAEVDNQLITTLVAAAGAAPDAAALTAGITKARARAGSGSLDDKLAESYAQRAANLLEKLAINRGQLDVSVAAAALMRALDDSRVEIAKSSANVLAMIQSKEAQAAVAAKALDDKTAEDLKIATFKALAKSAKNWGNQLDANTTDALQKVVETSQSLPVRSAAAEAQGALNLPADRAKNLIVQQSQVGK